MTTIITRLYPDQAAAQAVADALDKQGLALTAVDIITQAGAVAPTDQMARAKVGPDAAAAYAAAMEGGKALLVVNAPVTPFGTALKAIRTVNKFPAIDVGLEDEDVYVSEEMPDNREGRVLSGTVFFMSNPNRPFGHGHIFSLRTILSSRPRNSVMRGGAYMSTKFWPMKLVSKRPEKRSLTRDGWLASSLVGIPTLTKSWPPREEVPTIVK